MIPALGAFSADPQRCLLTVLCVSARSSSDKLIARDRRLHAAGPTAAITDKMFHAAK